MLVATEQELDFSEKNKTKQSLEKFKSQFQGGFSEQSAYKMK